MKTLRLVKFDPVLSIASRYWDEDEFRRNDDVSILSLDAQSQYIVAAAMAWAMAQLPAGFEALESVELKRIADVVTQWSEPIVNDSLPPEEQEQPVPLSYSPAFTACIVGNGAKGQSAIEINSQPGPETNGLAILWDQLSK